MSFVAITFFCNCKFSKRLAIAEKLKVYVKKERYFKGVRPEVWEKKGFLAYAPRP